MSSPRTTDCQYPIRPHTHHQKDRMRHTPETPSQAREFDKTNAHYRRLGLCTRCAPQAAYGHSDGFSSIHPPCAACLPIIAGFPKEEFGQGAALAVDGLDVGPLDCYQITRRRASEGGERINPSTSLPLVQTTLKTFHPARVGSG